LIDAVDMHAIRFSLLESEEMQLFGIIYSIKCF